MNSARNPLTGKAFILVLLACCAVLLINLRAMAQETNYTEEQYKAFQEIQAEQAAIKKAALALKFLQVPANAKCGLLKNVVSEWAIGMQGLQKAGNWSEIMRLGEQYAPIVPDDSYTIGLLAEGYAQSKNYRQFAAFGEKVFAKSPSGALAYQLAKAYQELGNDAKFIQWGEKTVSLNPGNYEILIELTKSYGVAKRWPEANKYASMCIKALETAKKPESASENDWKNYVNGSNAQCYAIIGNSAYESKNYTSAISNLEKSVMAFKRNDIAYYFLGMSYWQMGKADLAMLNFAKSFVLKGSTSQASKTYLDQLYKTGHANSLAGQERIIQRAKMDLGIQ
jgi:tetratricopeptide (TPR) repeat protein